MPRATGPMPRPGTGQLPPAVSGPMPRVGSGPMPRRHRADACAAPGPCPDLPELCLRPPGRPCPDLPGPCPEPRLVPCRARGPGRSRRRPRSAAVLDGAHAAGPRPGRCHRSPTAGGRDRDPGPRPDRSPEALVPGGPVPGGALPRGGTGPRPRPTGPMATGTGPRRRPAPGPMPPSERATPPDGYPAQGRGGRPDGQSWPERPGLAGGRPRRETGIPRSRSGTAASRRPTRTSSTGSLGLACPATGAPVNTGTAVTATNEPE